MELAAYRMVCLAELKPFMQTGLAQEGFKHLTRILNIMTLWPETDFVGTSPHLV
jgi:hypothetical protein